VNSRRDKRKQAYQFIRDKLHESGHKLSYNTAKAIDVSSVISLAEMDNLKRGYADPSEELVAGLKKLLHRVAGEGEIEEYLVKPFLSKYQLSK